MPTMTRTLAPALALALALLLLASLGAADDAPQPVRLATGVSGHIHPAACVTKSGTVLVVFSQSNYKDLRLSKSADGGKTWSEPVAFKHTAKLEIYPGSLTALADGRVVHAWNTWYTDAKGTKSRFVQFSVSKDDGKTWDEPKSLPKNENAFSVVRHPFIELSDEAWLFSLSDRTVTYNPKTDAVANFADGANHGLVPIIRTPKGTLVSGAGKRSTDGGKKWEKVSPFPEIDKNGWRFDMTALDNGYLVVSEVQGEGIGGNKWRFVVSRDDGKSWDFKDTYEFYAPGRAIGGRACPRTVQLDKDTIGTVFYDDDKNQPGGSGVFFLRTPIKALAGK
jgi:hypothetical protein